MRKNRTPLQLAMHVSKVSIIVNILLSVFKFLAGIIGNSEAMISDAIHSASDVFSTIIVIIGVRVSNKAADKGHAYGHEKMECIASVLLAVVLAITGLGIGYDAVINIVEGNYANNSVPSMLPLAAAIISIVVKEWMFWFTKAAAKKINSSALAADAWHHRTDALSSIGSFIGIFGARMGAPVLDSVASLVICLFIVKAAYDIFKDSTNKLVDASADSDTVEKIKIAITDIDGVDSLDEIKTRLFGDKIYVDIEIGTDGNQTLWDAHYIAESVHEAIETQFPTVKHCMVHVNPTKPKEESENNTTE